jgi:hypothetical protein
MTRKCGKYKKKERHEETRKRKLKKNRTVLNGIWELKHCPCIFGSGKMATGAYHKNPIP